jgi:hypothetical protein
MGTSSLRELVMGGLNGLRTDQRHGQALRAERTLERARRHRERPDRALADSEAPAVKVAESNVMAALGARDGAGWAVFSDT